MTPQEKALEYLIWDLASCLPGPPGPTCTPTTCAAVGANCGPLGDGCGGELQCGSCGGCATCGGGGTPSQCGGTCCVPETCASQNIECGPAGDGCGNVLQCGSRSGNLSCGGGGINGKCGSIDAGPSCLPLTCAMQNIQCGPAGDGCGTSFSAGLVPDRRVVRRGRYAWRVRPGLPAEDVRGAGLQLRPVGGRLRPRAPVRNVHAAADVRRRRQGKSVRGNHRQMRSHDCVHAG